MEKAVPGPPPLPPPLPPGALPPPALCMALGAVAAPGSPLWAPPCAPRLGRSSGHAELAPGSRAEVARGSGSAQCGSRAAFPLSHKEGGGGRAGGLGVSPSGLIHLLQITLHFLPPPAAEPARSLSRACSQRPDPPAPRGPTNYY